MKKIYKIGTKQNFTHTTFELFKKNKEECWIIRNVKYIYSDNEEDAIDKYMKWFFKEYESIAGYRDWYSKSDNVDIGYLAVSHTNITSTALVLVDEDKDIDVNYEELKENMQAENFKEWWFSELTKYLN